MVISYKPSFVREFKKLPAELQEEALERIDSGVLFLLLRYDEQGTKLIVDNQSNFEKALQTELSNVTLRIPAACALAQVGCIQMPQGILRRATLRLALVVTGPPPDDTSAA